MVLFTLHPFVDAGRGLGRVALQEFKETSDENIYDDFGCIGDAGFSRP